MHAIVLVCCFAVHDIRRRSLCSLATKAEHDEITEQAGRRERPPLAAGKSASGHPRVEVVDEAFSPAAVVAAALPSAPHRCSLPSAQMAVAPPKVLLPQRSARCAVPAAAPAEEVAAAVAVAVAAKQTVAAKQAVA